MKIKMKTEEVLGIITNSMDPNEWCVIRELKIGAGLDKDVMQRLDLWAINYRRSKRYMTRSFEVKVSRSDFLSEMKKPLKRRAGIRLSNEFYFVTPKGLVDIMEIPVECGLLEVSEDGSISQTIPAPFRDINPLPSSLVAMISRRADKDRIKSWEENYFYPTYYNKHALDIINAHVKKWREHNIGSKEIPDRIADAIEMLKLELEDEIKRVKIESKESF